MTDWADEIVEALPDGKGGMFSVDPEDIAQALRDVKAAETARCLAIVNSSFLDDEARELHPSDILANIVERIESGEAP